MAKVKASQRGYYGGVVREPGETFEWHEEKLASWVTEAKSGKSSEPFGGKGDHDGDGKPGGSLPGDRATAKRGGGKKKAETVNAPEGEPFADAPEPEVIEGNGVTEALGGPAPDWIAPGTPHAVED